MNPSKQRKQKHTRHIAMAMMLCATLLLLTAIALFLRIRNISGDSPVLGFGKTQKNGADDGMEEGTEASSGAMDAAHTVPEVSDETPADPSTDAIIKELRDQKLNVPTEDYIPMIYDTYLKTSDEAVLDYMEIVAGIRLESADYSIVTEEYIDKSGNMVASIQSVYDDGLLSERVHYQGGSTNKDVAQSVLHMYDRYARMAVGTYVYPLFRNGELYSVQMDRVFAQYKDSQTELICQVMNYKEGLYDETERYEGQNCAYSWQRLLMEKYPVSESTFEFDSYGRPSIETVSIDGEEKYTVWYRYE